MMYDIRNRRSGMGSINQYRFVWDFPDALGLRQWYDPELSPKHDWKYWAPMGDSWKYNVIGKVCGGPTRYSRFEILYNKWMVRRRRLYDKVYRMIGIKYIEIPFIKYITKPHPKPTYGNTIDFCCEQPTAVFYPRWYVNYKACRFPEEPRTYYNRSKCKDIALPLPNELVLFKGEKCEPLITINPISIT